MARLALEIVVLHFDVPELELQRSLGLAELGDFLLEKILCTSGLGFALLILGLSITISIRLYKHNWQLPNQGY